MTTTLAHRLVHPPVDVLVRLLVLRRAHLQQFLRRLRDQRPRLSRPPHHPRRPPRLAPLPRLAHLLLPVPTHVRQRVVRHAALLPRRGFLLAAAVGDDERLRVGAEEDARDEIFSLRPRPLRVVGVGVGVQGARERARRRRAGRAGRARANVRPPRLRTDRLKRALLDAVSAPPPRHDAGEVVVVQVPLPQSSRAHLLAHRARGDRARLDALLPAPHRVREELVVLQEDRLEVVVVKLSHAQLLAVRHVLLEPPQRLHPSLGAEMRALPAAVLLLRVRPDRLRESLRGDEPRAHVEQRERELRPSVAQARVLEPRDGDDEAQRDRGVFRVYRPVPVVVHRVKQPSELRERREVVHLLEDAHLLRGHVVLEPPLAARVRVVAARAAAHAVAARPGARGEGEARGRGGPRRAPRDVMPTTRTATCSSGDTVSR
eukprot:30925-Pelagococcus_subviridis.AAC.5